MAVQAEGGTARIISELEQHPWRDHGRALRRCTLLSALATQGLLSASNLRVVVLVYTSSARALAALVLLDGRMRPAAERSKVRERRVVVVVSVPQRQAREQSSITSDRAPLRLAGVDTHMHATALQGRHHLLQESTVSLLAAPDIGGLHINPDHANLVWWGGTRSP